MGRRRTPEPLRCPRGRPYRGKRAVDLVLLGRSPVFGLISLGIAVWIVTLVLHDTSRGYARIWFR